MSSFDALADGYDAWYQTPLGAWVEERELVSLKAVMAPGDRANVIEIGAGTGRLAESLARWGYNVTAVEPSAPMMAYGTRRTSGLHVDWIAGRAESLASGAAMFDIAVLFTTLEFVADPAGALAEALRVTSPGGRLVVGFLHALSPWAALYRHHADHGHPPWSGARFFVPDDFDQLIGSSPDFAGEAVHLAPDAAPPFDDAELAGLRAGNRPALSIRSWARAWPPPYTGP